MDGLLGALERPIATKRELKQAAIAAVLSDLDAELTEEATCKDHLQVRVEGNREVTRKLRHYRLERIRPLVFGCAAFVGHSSGNGRLGA